MKLKHKMARAALQRKIEQKATAVERFQDDPDSADEIRRMSPEEFLESVGREEVEIINPHSGDETIRYRHQPLRLRIAEKKSEIFRDDNTHLQGRLRKVRQLIEDLG